MGLRTTETEADNIDTPEFWARYHAELAEPVQALPLDERIERLHGRLYHMHGEQREQMLAEIAKLTAELDAQRAAEAAERDAEWTAEVTAARRAEWNAAVGAGTFNRNGKFWWPTARAWERERGWTHEQLSAAVKRHKEV